MGNQEVILKVGSEGGSLTVSGSKEGEYWNFHFASLDQSEALVDEHAEEIKHACSYPSIYDVFEAMNQYPWHRLYPLRVHPSFKDQIHKEVLRRYADEGQMNRLPEEWEDVLHREE